MDSYVSSTPIVPMFLAADGASSPPPQPQRGATMRGVDALQLHRLLQAIQRDPASRQVVARVLDALAYHVLSHLEERGYAGCRCAAGHDDDDDWTCTCPAVDPLTQSYQLADVLSELYCGIGVPAPPEILAGLRPHPAA